jgi:hypothetical protein
MCFARTVEFDLPVSRSRVIFGNIFYWKTMRPMRPEVECSALVTQPTKPVALQDTAGATAVFCHHMEHQTEEPTFGRHLCMLTQQISLAAKKSKINKITIFTLSKGWTVRGSNHGGRKGGFPHLSRPNLGPTQPLTQYVPSHSRR